VTSRPDVRPLLFPRSLALVGATPRRPDVVAGVLRGDVPAFGVNPNHADVLGLPCVESVSAIPEAPETAVLLVGHTRLVEAFEDAAAAGVRSFIVPGLGNEAGQEGPRLASWLARRADEIGAAVLGPNCMGVACPGGSSAWIGTVPETAASGHVSAVCQSGSIAEALLGLGGRVGFRCVVSSGGEAVTDAADLISFLADDPGTKAITVFLETVRRPAAFRDALARCARAEKPVVCLPVGRSEAAARVALAHTGAIVGSRRALSAVLRRYGVIEVDDFHELVETLEVLGRCRRPTGARIAAISESGGEAALLADHGEAAGLPFEPFSESLAASLVSEFPNYGSPSNPLDAWAVAPEEVVYPRSLELMAAAGAFDVLIAQVDVSQFRGETEQGWVEMVVRALHAVTRDREVFPAVVTVHSADPPARLQEIAAELDIALLRGMRTGMRALANVVGWRPARVDEPEVGEPVAIDDLLASDGPLPEHESALALERYGVRVVRRLRATTPEEAARAAEEIGPPVVVKVDGPAHKSRDGGVVLGVESAARAHEVAERLGGSVLVAAQRAPGPEALCGMTRDPMHGPVIAVGAGGTAVEALDRVVVTCPPLDHETALATVAAAGVDTAQDEVAYVLEALARIALDHPEIVEVDVNPLILGPDGAVAVDALVVVDRRGSQ
jgi:acetyltransferase